MAFLHDDVQDDGLDGAIKTRADSSYLDLHICTAQPADYTEATSTYTKGDKNVIAVTGPAAGDSSGRKVTISAISDGDCTGDGTVTHWAIVDTNKSILVAAHTLASSQAVSNGNTFTLTAFDIEIPDPA